MRYFLLLLSFFLVAPIFGQNKMLEKAKRTSGASASPEADRIYVNDDWQPVSKAQASYYLVKQFVENVMLISSVPTYDQGLAMKAEETGLVRYLYNYHYLNNQIAFSVQVIAMKSDPDQFNYDGSAVWYNEDGSLLAKGAFDKGKLNGDYTEYDKNGAITVQKKYMAGKEFDATRSVHQPLLGKWAIITKGNNKSEKHLYNTFNEDGTLIIETVNLSTAFNPPMKLSSPTPQTFLWKYLDDGILEVYYPDGRLLGKEKTQINDDQFIATITQHVSPELVGKKYVFKKMK